MRHSPLEIASILGALCVGIALMAIFDPFNSNKSKYVAVDQMISQTTEIKPAVEATNEIEANKSSNVDERTQCPHQSYDQKTLDRVFAALVDPSNKGKFVSWQNDYGNETNNPHNVRVVYIDYIGIRYTLWYAPAEVVNGIEREGLVSVWERPDGTHDREAIDTYTDERIDGCVNFGVGGKSRYGENRHLMHWQDKTSSNQGVEYHKNWQASYCLAIAGLMTTLNKI